MTRGINSKIGVPDSVTVGSTGEVLLNGRRTKSRVRDGWYERYDCVDAHRMKVPRGWAIQSAIWHQVVWPLCDKGIRIRHKNGVVYETSIRTFDAHKMFVERSGYGKQWCLPMDHWAVRSKAQPEIKLWSPESA